MTAQTENIIYKNINQYCFELTKEQYSELYFILNKCKSVKNYVYSNFGGINNYLTIFNSRKEIRDVWTKTNFIDNWNIPRRYVRNAIEDSISNIKTNWIQTLKNVKEKVKNNKQLNDEQKHYIFYILKSKELLAELLKYKYIKNVPKKFVDLSNKDKEYIYSFICRNIRKYKPISHTKKLSVQIDGEMYSYKNGLFYLTGLNKNHRIELKVNTNNEFKGNLRIRLDEEKLIISRAIEIEPKENNNEEKVIGIDKNYVNAIDTSTENSYGEGLNKIQIEVTDKLNEKNKKRQFYYQLIKDYKKIINDKDTDIKEKEKLQKKISHIYKFNLGKKKYNREKNRAVENIKKHINKGINELIKNENHTELVCENLNFQGKKKNYRSKRVNNLLSGWMKGYLQERIEYKNRINDIKTTKVNAACTSQVCSQCDRFGERKGDKFHCQCLGDKGVNSGHSAAKVVLSRKYDKDINLYTSHKEVKNILKKRLIDKYGEENIEKCNCNQNKPNQPRPILEIKSERIVKKSNHKKL